MAHRVVPGAAARSHVGTLAAGVVVVHGFGGSPASVAPLADAFAAAGLHVECPRLPGHGTHVDDLAGTGWADWVGQVDAALDRVAGRLDGRIDRVVVAGTSMGGALALWSAINQPRLAGVICVNPVVRPQPVETIEMLRDLLDDGISAVPAGAPDIADPGAVDVAYDRTPIAALLALSDDGLAPMSDRYGELMMPMRLFTSRHDHVVDPADSERLAAAYGGEVHHTWLERSHHVAVLDVDRDLIAAESLDFVVRVTAP